MASLMPPTAIAVLILAAGAFCALSLRHVTGDLRRILLWSIGCMALVLVSDAFAIARALSGDDRFLLYGRLALVVALFIFASVVYHIRTHICVRCSVGDEHGP